MVDQTHMLARVRSLLGDFGTEFRDVLTGTGDLSEYDLSQTRVTVTKALLVQEGQSRELIAGTDYTLLSREGRLLFRERLGPLPLGAVVIVEGRSGGMVDDQELAIHLQDAVLQHCSDRVITVRYRSAEGFYRYEDEPVTLATLPEIEELPLAILAAVNFLWAVATDASMEPNIHTAEGTHIDRGQIYAQVMAQIENLEARYRDLCQQLNVGLYRIEMATLRRVSPYNNRLVPIFTPREYDDSAYPTRQLPPIDRRNEDPSGIASPIISGLTG
ncbi:hypothetical protein [Streptomyces rimosus]|uniref:hypothetical protein n=1 Tax=Streptomyces rimosus TaxID=1927 RepID=UPI0004C7E2B0|nr:hypothetical protein [Streptomyces rimosus]